jgi:hypothetical protein
MSCRTRNTMGAVSSGWSRIKRAPPGCDRGGASSDRSHRGGNPFGIGPEQRLRFTAFTLESQRFTVSAWARGLPDKRNLCHPAIEEVVAEIDQMMEVLRTGGFSHTNPGRSIRFTLAVDTPVGWLLRFSGWRSSGGYGEERSHGCGYGQGGPFHETVSSEGRGGSLTSRS